MSGHSIFLADHPHMVYLPVLRVTVLALVWNLFFVGVVAYQPSLAYRPSQKSAMPDCELVVMSFHFSVS